MSSILNDVKKMLNLDADYHEFDTDVLIHINGTFSKLNQIGVRDESFMVTGTTEEWDDYVSDTNVCALVKQYMYANVRMLFDPPTTSFVLAAIEKIVEQYEFRLNALCDPGLTEV